MHSTTINTLQSRTNDALQSTRVVRTGSAAGAQGFAQIMQTFDSKSELAESIEQSQDADQSSAQDADDLAEQDVEADSDTQSNSEGKTEQDVANDQAVDQRSDVSSESALSDEQQAAVDPKPATQQQQQQQQPGESVSTQIASQEPIDGTKADEASLRLLENQAEQAKFTIKGLTRSLTHAADANLTDIAVSTRLGRDTGAEPQVQIKQASPEQAQPEQPKPTRTIPQSQFASAKITSGHAVQTNTTTETHQSSSTTPVPVDARVDQSGVEVQQVKSQRGDAASMVAQAGSPTRSIDQTASKLDANQLAGVNRTTTQQTNRAVSGVESSNIGSQQSDTSTNTLVDKMKATELPSETRRAAVLAQVQRGLASMLRSGKSEMVLKLTPGNLGEVRINIKTDGDRLTIRFETSSQEATDHLNASAKELHTNLRAKGINLENIQIEQAPTDDADASDASKVFDSSATDQSDQHGQDSNQRNAQHKSDREPGVEPGDDPLFDEPQSIWTELGLDAIA